MNEIRKKTKICLDEKLAVVDNNQNTENSTEQAASTVVTTDFSAPNTGFNNAGAFGGLAFIVLAVLILATVIVVKSGKKAKGLFAAIFMTLAMFAPAVAGPRANAEECAKWGWSKYDVVARIDLSHLPGGRLMEKIFEGTGDAESDAKAVRDWVADNKAEIERIGFNSKPNVISVNIIEIPPRPESPDRDWVHEVEIEDEE